MQTTLRIDDDTYREARAKAASLGITVTRFIEDALCQHIAGQQTEDGVSPEVVQQNQLMEALLQRTAHFRVGPKPTREEMNER